MNITKTLTIIIAVSLLYACDSSKKTQQESVESSSKEVAEEQHQEAETEQLRLNNGAKWAADESTFFGMQKLEAALNSFNKTSTSPTISDYNTLGNALANINKEIISQCSMKGEDHDQLHLVLHPMLDNVAVIKSANDISKIKENTESLSKSLGLFFEYFEIK